MVLIWNFIFIYLIKYILTDKKIKSNRKLDSIQVIEIKVISGTKVKIVNSDFIPDRVYLKGELYSIDSTGSVLNLNENINDIRMEWDIKRGKYSKLFRNIESMIEVNFTDFDTTEVTLLSNMFQNCKNLKKITFNDKFNTSSVSDMTSMFENCISLTSLDLSIFDTRIVAKMEGMFRNCQSLTSLDLSNFQTPKLLKIAYMFQDCESLEYLDISNMDTSLITYMNGTFSDCWSLISLNLTNFDTRKVIFMNEMFMNCKKLELIDLSSFITNNVIDSLICFMGVIL